MASLIIVSFSVNTQSVLCRARHVSDPSTHVLLRPGVTARHRTAPPVRKPKRHRQLGDTSGEVEFPLTTDLTGWSDARTAGPLRTSPERVVQEEVWGARPKGGLAIATRGRPSLYSRLEAIAIVRKDAHRKQQSAV